jgi:acetyl esterase/lipase
MGILLLLRRVWMGLYARFSYWTSRAPARRFFDLAYASASPAQKLDLYLPTQGEGPFPLVIWVHGGAWLVGDKRSYLGDPPAIAFQLLRRGYALASLNYRLSQEARFPAQIQDVKTAVRWLRLHAQDYSLDPDRFGAWGASAGGHLAALLGTSEGIPELEGEHLGSAGAPGRVQAVVDWFGPTDFLQMDRQAAAVGCPTFGDGGHDSPGSPESRLVGAPIQERPDLVQAANPIAYIRAGMPPPPFLIQHGTQDCIVPVGQSLLLSEALLPVLGEENLTLTLLPAGHGAPPVPGEPFNSAANTRLIIDFFARHLL